MQPSISHRLLCSRYNFASSIEHTILEAKTKDRLQLSRLIVSRGPWPTTRLKEGTITAHMTQQHHETSKHRRPLVPVFITADKLIDADLKVRATRV